MSSSSLTQNTVAQKSPFENKNHEHAQANISYLKRYTTNIIEINVDHVYLHNTRVEDMDGILDFYWFFIMLDAITYALKLQLHTHSCF